MQTDKGAEWEVEQLISKRGKKGSCEYLVRWKCFGPEDDTWEPRSSLRVHAQGKIAAFEECQQQVCRGLDPASAAIPIAAIPIAAC